MKNILLFVLISLVLTQVPQCKVYETYDQQKQQCVKVCEETEYFNKLIWNNKDEQNEQDVQLDQNQ